MSRTTSFPVSLHGRSASRHAQRTFSSSTVRPRPPVDCFLPSRRVLPEGCAGSTHPACRTGASFRKVAPARPHPPRAGSTRAGDPPPRTDHRPRCRTSRLSPGRTGCRAPPRPTRPRAGARPGRRRRRPPRAARAASGGRPPPRRCRPRTRPADRSSRSARRSG